MQCPNCGGEFGNGIKCDYCGSYMTEKMKKTFEFLNKKGCPSCTSSNIEFRREEEGES
jgi:hypothetical protein